MLQCASELPSFPEALKAQAELRMLPAAGLPEEGRGRELAAKSEAQAKEGCAMHYY